MVIKVTTNLVFTSKKILIYYLIVLFTMKFRSTIMMEQHIPIAAMHRKSVRDLPPSAPVCPTHPPFLPTPPKPDLGPDNHT